ncbi:hypothetical protein AURDEDRAFT_121754 [Auricularia subglabra TFB-10046 SS5]|nr:hypothetical protein AURDEDRAFT_121754 [Auricularia subglabra TFB-10046 SS5]
MYSATYQLTTLRLSKGRIHVRNPESQRVRDVGTAPKLMGGNYSSFSHLEAAKRHQPSASASVPPQHQPAAPPAPPPGPAATLPPVAAVPPIAPLATVPSAATAAQAAATQSAVNLQKLDENQDFIRALSTFFAANGLPAWAQPKAKVMSQRLERYLHVCKAQDLMADWKTSLSNTAYDIPFDWEVDGGRWACGHFTIKAIHVALGLKHMTASDDQAAFTVPRKHPQGPEVAAKRIQPILDWVKKPDDTRLMAKFGSMAWEKFTDMRTAALEGRARIDVKDPSQRVDSKAKSSSSSGVHRHDDRDRQHGSRHRERNHKQEHNQSRSHHANRSISKSASSGSSSRGRKRKHSPSEGEEDSYVHPSKKQLACLTKKRSSEIDRYDSDYLDASE